MGTDCKSAAFQLRWFESTRAHEKTAGVEVHWRFSFAQMSDSHRRVDENSSGADCNDDERRQRRKQRGVVGAAASDTQARRSGCWVPQPVRLRRRQGGEAGAALRFFKAPPMRLPPCTPPVVSPAAYRPGMTFPCVSRTSASALIFRPPIV